MYDTINMCCYKSRDSTQVIQMPWFFFRVGRGVINLNAPIIIIPSIENHEMFAL